MAGHVERLIVPYTPDDMFSLVADVETYPKFIKWVKALRKSRPRIDGTTHHCIGEAVVGFKGFTERFATSVATDTEELSVRARLVRGPFKKLENDWHFAPTDDNQTQITFWIDYQFSNPLLAALAAANRETAIRRIMEAFLSEAARRFTPVSMSGPAVSANPSEPGKQNAAETRKPKETGERPLNTLATEDPATG
ncbi:MAG: type II toxin-antitoxin system RatA family toxin [Pseudomonadota bacterium]